MPDDLAREGMVLQVEESGSALDVGEGFGRVIFCHSTPNQASKAVHVEKKFGKSRIVDISKSDIELFKRNCSSKAWPRRQ